jgi:Family of unknown function (DUF5329)
MRARLFCAFLALVACAAQAAPLPRAARAEAEALLLRMQASGCEFQRNGSWYSGAEARAHLLKKLDYLEGKGLVNTTEQFIVQGASASSMSGKPYLVRCPGKPVQESGPWLSAALQQLRQPGGGAAPETRSPAAPGPASSPSSAPARPAPR